MDLKEAAKHCDRAWQQYAEKFQIVRDIGGFYKHTVLFVLCRWL